MKGTALILSGLLVVVAAGCDMNLDDLQERIEGLDDTDT